MNQENQFTRIENLLGKENLQKLQNSCVAVFGLGGVGSFVVEALVRSGVQNIHIIDNDTVNVTNINRQLIAMHSTIGKNKVDVMKDRILDINPKAKVSVYNIFYLPETKDLFDFSKFDYVIDAVDTVTAKIQIILQAKQNDVPIISCMGTGNKIDALQFRISDIYKTDVCPLARVMRHECKKRGIKDVKVCYSVEKPKKINSRVPSSVAFVPSVAGLLIAGEVIKDLCNL